MLYLLFYFINFNKIKQYLKNYIDFARRLVLGAILLLLNLNDLVDLVSIYII
jgi:hypothetical protein